MSTPVVINGVTYNIPAYNEVGWTQGSGNLSSFLVVVGTIASARRLDGTVVSSAIPQASAISSTGTGNNFDITNVSLGAGIWSVSANIGFSYNSATVSLASGGIGTGAGASGTGLVLGDTLLQAPPPLSTYDTSLSVVNVIQTLAVTTIIYLKANINFSAGTPKSYGRITAIQIG